MSTATPQVENGYIRIANEIWDEVIRRDFSKRQKDILLFIWRLSYGCQKKSAFIPMLKDFGLCGVAQNHITAELKYLEQCKIIFWDRENFLFDFNKNYELWQISPVKAWDDGRFKELLYANLQSKHSSQKGKSTNDDFPKKEVDTSQKRKSDFLKREVGDGLNPCGSKAEDASKDIFKEIIKDIAPLVDEKVPSSTSISYDQTDEIANHFCMRRGKGTQISTADYHKIKELIEFGMPTAFVKSILDKCFNEYAPKHQRDEIRSISYCAPRIYDEWDKHLKRLTKPVGEGGREGNDTQTSYNRGHRHYVNNRSQSSLLSISDDELDEILRQQHQAEVPALQ